MFCDKFIPALSTICLLILGTSAVNCLAARYDGQFEIVVTEEQSGKPLPVRMELTDGRGRPVKVRAEGVITRKHYFVFDGAVTLRLKKGAYRFLLDAGPEYQTRQGHFTIERHADDSQQITLKRYVNMAEEGWWAGDLDSLQRPDDLPLMKEAARIQFAPQTTAANVMGKFQQLSSKASLGSGITMLQDYRRGGGLQILNNTDGQIPEALISELEPEASSLPILTAAAEVGADVVALSPSVWDLPLWIATDKLTAIEILHRGLRLDRQPQEEGWGRPRNRDLFPGNRGIGIYSESIYHHVLNCGIRIPPAAGSGSGSASQKTPLGMNRVYVECGPEYSEEQWMDGLRAGRVTVTNGPLLRTSVEGHSPGHVFHLDRGVKRQFQIALSLSFYERAPVEYLEIIKNGRVEHNIRLSELAEKRGKLPPLEFDQSGWFLVRAITGASDTYQLASTGPYYVEQNYEPRISRKSVTYFLTWLDEAAETFADNPDVVTDIERARLFWEELLSRANAE